MERIEEGIEAEIGEKLPLAHAFDMIAATTTTGALLALAITKPHVDQYAIVRTGNEKVVAYTPADISKIVSQKSYVSLPARLSKMLGFSLISESLCPVLVGSRAFDSELAKRDCAFDQFMLDAYYLSTRHNDVVNVDFVFKRARELWPHSKEIVVATVEPEKEMVLPRASIENWGNDLHARTPNGEIKYALSADDWKEKIHRLLETRDALKRPDVLYEIARIAKDKPVFPVNKKYEVRSDIRPLFIAAYLGHDEAKKQFFEIERECQTPEQLGYWYALAGHMDLLKFRPYGKEVATAQQFFKKSMDLLPSYPVPAIGLAYTKALEGDYKGGIHTLRPYVDNCRSSRMITNTFQLLDLPSAMDRCCSSDDAIAKLQDINYEVVRSDTDRVGSDSVAPALISIKNRLLGNIRECMALFSSYHHDTNMRRAESYYTKAADAPHGCAHVQLARFRAKELLATCFESPQVAELCANHVNYGKLYERRATFSSMCKLLRESNSVTGEKTLRSLHNSKMPLHKTLVKFTAVRDVRTIVDDEWSFSVLSPSGSEMAKPLLRLVLPGIKISAPCVTK